MPAREISQESGFLLATTPATSLERRFTLAAMVVLLLIFVATVWFANLRLVESDGFIPFIQAMMFVSELVTAILLYTQFTIIRSHAILILASGYLFTSLIVIAHTLTFPSAFAPNGLLGAGLQTTGWLHFTWHLVFPASVIFYAWMKNRTVKAKDSSVKAIIGLSIASVVGLVIAITWGLIEADAFMPRLILNKTTFAPLAAQTGLLDSLVSVVAFLLLWRRQSSVLDRWLMIAIFATILEMAMLLVLAGRFTVGWYAVRLFGVTASTVVLVGLLTETMVLYARLANAIVLLRRERANRLMSLDAATSAMAHELKQPLTGIVTTGAAALRWLKRTPPDLKEVHTCIAKMIDSGHRADHIISSVRELFKKQGDHRTELYIHDVAKQALSLAQKDLQINGVSVSTQFQNNLPTVYADRTQLQQVILNLIRNAIDAMATPSLRTKSLRLATSLNGQSTVLLSVQDSGPGIGPETAARIFEPFFTTKAAGMGLGLSICQTIVEDHGGNLRIAKTDSEGCVFEITLPIAAKTGRAVPEMQS